MEEMLKARSLQDAGLFAPVRAAAPVATGNLNTTLVYKPSGK